MEIPNRKTNITLALTAAVSVCVISLVVISQTVTPKPKVEAQFGSITLNHQNISAKAAVVYDPSSGRVLYSINEDEQLPLASLAKIMVATAVLNNVPQDNLVVITQQDLKPEGDSKLRVGEKWSLSQLIKLGIVASSNDAMAAAASNAGNNIVEYMNQEAGKLGLTHTYFSNTTGLDLNHEASGAYGSARDVAVLAAAFLKKYPEFFESTARPYVSITSQGTNITATSTSIPLLSVPGFIGAKTGYTELAGGNLVAVFDIDVGYPIIIVVLGSTRENRFSDVLTLINALRNRL